MLIPTFKTFFDDPQYEAKRVLVTSCERQAPTAAAPACAQQADNCVQSPFVSLVEIVTGSLDCTQCAETSWRTPTKDSPG